MRFKVGDKVQLTNDLPCVEVPNLGLVAGASGRIIRFRDGHFDVEFETGTYTFDEDNIAGVVALMLGTGYLEVIDGNL